MALNGTYIPSPKQAQFHKDKHFCKVLLCGVGFGKTTAAVYEILKKVFKECPGKNGMVVAPTIEMMRRGIFRVWQEIVPSDWYTFNANTKEMIIKETNSKIYWVSSYDPERLQGAEVAWVAFDEAAAEKDPRVFSELVNRLRDPDPKIKPQIFITTTPNLGWMQDQFGEGPGGKFQGTDDCWFNEESIVIRATTYDNTTLAKTGYVDNIISQAPSQEWIDQNVYARYVAKSGAVFKEFKPSQHVVTSIPRNISNVFAAFDFGMTAPSCLSVIAVTSDDKVFVIEETYKNGMTWDEHGWFQEFKRIKEQYGVQKIIVDNAHNERIAASNRFFNHRPSFIPSIKDTEESINRMKKLFLDQRLFIHKSCHNTISELQRWSWASDKHGKAMDKPQAGGDHAIDPIRYWSTFMPAPFFARKVAEPSNIVGKLPRR